MGGSTGGTSGGRSYSQRMLDEHGPGALGVNTSVNGGTSVGIGSNTDNSGRFARPTVNRPSVPPTTVTRRPIPPLIEEPPVPVLTRKQIQDRLLVDPNFDPINDNPYNNKYGDAYNGYGIGDYLDTDWLGGGGLGNSGPVFSNGGYFSGGGGWSGGGIPKNGSTKDQSRIGFGGSAGSNRLGGSNAATSGVDDSGGTQDPLGGMRTMSMMAPGAEGMMAALNGQMPQAPQQPQPRMDLAQLIQMLGGARRRA